MNSTFEISQTCTEKERPAVSKEVRNYFIKFFIENVFESKKIILGTKWKIVLSILFVGEGKRFNLNKIILAKGARTISAENTKIFEVHIPLTVIDNVENKQSKTIELLYEAIGIFLVSNYKKIKPEFISQLWKDVDQDYLLSLPYPVPFEDQDYLEDKFTEID